MSTDHSASKNSSQPSDFNAEIPALPEKALQELAFESLQKALKEGLTVVTELWSYPTRDWVSSVHAADIDNDGDIEILVGSRDGTMYTLSKRGGFKWKFEKNNVWLGTVFGIGSREVVDKARVFVGSRDNKVYALDHVGRILWSYSTEHVVRQVYAYDIDQDGNTEVLVGSEDRYIYALDYGTGKCLWKYRTNGWIRSIYPIDIDNDGKIEILAGSGDKYLYALDNEGCLKWKHNSGSKIHTIYAMDLDGDGIVEILIGSDAKDITVLTPERNIKWKFEPENRILSIFVVDLDNDGQMEIIAGSEDKHIYILSSKGKLLWKYFLGVRVFSVHAIDLDHDGSQEILAGGEDGKLHVFRVHIKNNLLSNIIKFYTALGHPNPISLDLSLLEKMLLQDLVIGNIWHDHGPTLESVEQEITNSNYLRALSMILILDDQQLQLLWRINTGHVRTVCLEDLNNDSIMEVAVGTDDGFVHTLDKYGNILWSYSIGDRVWMVQAGDVNLDGTVEVIVGSGDGFVYAINGSTGFIDWQIRMDDWIRSVYVTNPILHGSTEIVMGSEGKKIHIYNTNLSPIIEPIITPHSIRAICVHKSNTDDTLEIIAGTDDNNVYAYSRGGIPLWVYKTKDRVRALYATDIDNDGIVEIIVGSEDRNVHVLDNKGQLKWRYHTPHRVLDMDVIDINQDGIDEILVGAGDGSIYVLSGIGDLLWRYKVSDRVRGIRAKDIDKDGNVEIAVGSEDRMAYLLQILDKRQLKDQIEFCWSQLERDRLPKKLVYELVQNPDAHIRAFALRKLVISTDLLNEDFVVLQQLIKDSSIHVRKTLAYATAILYQIHPDQTRRLLDQLSSDLEPDVRLAFVDSLPAITKIDWHVGFEYLDRFTRDDDRWVRRAVVRKLHLLVEDFPQQVFRFLLIMSQDEREWIRQESARSLAYYFDLHEQNLLVGVRALITRGIELQVMKMIAHRATKSIVCNVFHAQVDLLSDLDETNIQDKLNNVVIALEEAKSLKHGEEAWVIHREFYRLHGMRSVSEIARYKCMIEQKQSNDSARFEDTLKILHRLNDISNKLETYLKREGLGDRLASLLDVTTIIETIYTQIGREYFAFNKQNLRFPDQHILEILLTKWRSIVTIELSHLRGKADIRPQLETKEIRLEEQISIWLKINNVGRSPADNFKVTLEESDDFEVVGNSNIEFDMVPAQDAVVAEFTIRPKISTLHLTFELIYDDAEAKGKILLFGDRAVLSADLGEFTYIQNPYSAGPPIQNKDMFYGREDDLQFLKESLTFTSANTIVVLYGQRRLGKSSLLYQLVNTSILEPHIPVYIDMQHESMALTTSTLLFNIAFNIYRRLRMKRIRIDEPDEKDFDRRATRAFDLFLDDIELVVTNQKIILLIDEFEILERKISEKVLTPEIFEYLRSIMQHRRGFNFLLSGTHSIEQLTSDYWSVFFNIARHRKIVKLSEQAAKSLITEPVKGFLDYDPFAITKIRQLSADQPYFIQLICRSLVDHCNSLKKNYVTINDVNSVSDEVRQTGQVHFKWVWGQTSQPERLILSIIAQEGGEEGRSLSLTEIAEIHRRYALPYNYEQTVKAIHNLIERDIIEVVLDGTRFRVPIGLVRRWLRETKTIKHILQEDNILPD